MALPAVAPISGGGDSCFVSVLDDLATLERSRWEVWAEVNHGRFPAERFLQILLEELQFVLEDREGATGGRVVKKVAVKAAKNGDDLRCWYAVATRVLLQLVCDPNPVEFVPELLLPFVQG